MILLSNKAKKTADYTKTLDKPQLITIPINRNRQNYDFEIISGSFWEANGNEYLSKEDALSKGVPENEIFYEEDFIDDHVYLAYRYEKNNHNDKINLVNAKKAGFGVIRWLQGDLKGIEFMYRLYDTIIALNVLVYGYLTHSFIDKKILKKIKKDKQFQNELYFIVGEFGGKKLYNEIMQFGEK